MTFSNTHATGNCSTCLQNKENANGMGSLDKAIAKAWIAYERAAGLGVRVSPAAPILFFGNLDRYRKSPLRVLTVGKNPSMSEFPDGDRWRRFPLAKGRRGREPDRYCAALSAYFCTDPYKNWFDRGFENVLNGAGSSYYGGVDTSTALHTDICSPVATDPKWTDLDPSERKALMFDGVPLWRELLTILKPQIVLLSFAEKYRKSISFDPLDENEWEEVIYTSEHKQDGTLRDRAYKVSVCRYKVGGKPTLCAFGPAGETPFQHLDNDRKRKVGAIILKCFEKTIGTRGKTALSRSKLHRSA